MSQAAASARWTVLVVEDEPDILDTFKDLLEQSLPGVAVVAARSGAAGVHALTQQPVDLIMSDFKMPGMDGIEFLVQAKRDYPNVPRIMFTAFADDELAERALQEAIVDGFISKNLDPLEIIRQVAELLGYEHP